MNIAFKRFKTRQYITRKWGILLLAFIISIGTTSIPVNADSLPATNPVNNPFDIYAINDVEAPIITLPESYATVRPGQDYPISITVKDNKGIQDVTVFCYANSFNGSEFSEHKMTLNTITGKYEYTLSGNEISKNGMYIRFFFIATDLVGLKTTAYTTLIYTSNFHNTIPSPADLVFQRIYGRTPGSNIVYGPGIAEDQIHGEDIHIINPTDYPVIALPTYRIRSKLSYSYAHSIAVMAEDNKGIQKVTIDYNIGDKSYHDLEMVKSFTGTYFFSIPKSQISDIDSDSFINYTITATNLDGLKTTTDALTISITSKEHLPTEDDFKMSLFAHTGKNTSQNYNALLLLPDGISTIKDVLSLDKDTQNVTVAGQLAYFVTDSANPVIQAIIDSAMYSLYINDSLGDDIKLGDQVTLTGDYSIENGFPMLKNITSKEVIGHATPTKPEILTIEYLKKRGLSRLGRFVKIKNVKLGANNPDGLTEITDETGSISLYKSTYPEQIKPGDTVDLYAIVTCTDATVQLRTGTIEANGYNSYDKLDGKPTLAIEPTDLFGPQTYEDYHIQVSAKDNDGIQKVTISYTIGDKTISNQKMTQNDSNKNYDYTIPNYQILAGASNISFTITATDVNGLSTSKTKTIPLSDDIKITSVSPDQNTISSNESLDIITQFTNGGATPKVTYTLKKNNEIFHAEGEIINGVDTSFYRLGTVSSGNYTVIATIVRTEDGKELNHEWHFTISE